MNKGTYSSIRYLATPGPQATQARSASLTVTHVQVTVGFIGVHTVDPDWVVTNPDGSTPVVEWMEFVATDGSHRKCGISSSCNGVDPYISSTFKYKNLDGSDEHQVDEIWFIDPDDMKPYHVRLTRVPREGGHPKFEVY